MFAAKVKSPFVILLAIIILGALFISLSEDEPVVKVASDYSLNIKNWQTDNGSKVIFVQADELPMLDVRVVFDAGSARDGKQPGLASFTNMMLDLGAGEWNTNEIAERMDSIGASIGTSALRDMAVVSLRSLTDKVILTKAMDTLAAVLHTPRFPETEMARERKQVLISLKNKQQSPGDIVEELFYKNLYGDHAYATPVLGTVDSVKAFSRNDLVGFYKKYYVASNAVIAMVGAIDEKQAREIANRLSNGLGKGQHAPALPAVPHKQHTDVVTQHHPSTQTHILAGQAGMMRGDKDYFPLYVGNHILGGSGFGSRIVEEIREKRGLAYSSYSYFLPMRQTGPFIMGLQTRNGQAKEALQILNKTLTDFIEQGPTADELDHSKKNITGGFPLRIDSNKDITEYLALIGFYDLPLDYLQSFNRNVLSVTREQIMDAFKRRVNPTNLLTVMVGNMEQAKQAK